MAETCSRKLIVEVCDAKNLMPKDGRGTASAYVLVDFDGQRRRTKTLLRDLNPQWNEKLEFLVLDPDFMAAEILELNVYNDKKLGRRSNFLGKVKIAGSTFAKSGSESLVYYPLEKRSVFSQIKGELGLKICYVDEGPPAPGAAAAPTEKKSESEEKSEAAAPEAAEEKKKEDKTEEKTEEKEATKPPEEAIKSEEKPPENNNSPEETPAALSRELETFDPQRLHRLPSEKWKYQSSRELKSTTGIGSHGAYDLVDRMLFLYVRVVKSKLATDDAGSPVYAKLEIGPHSVRTESQTDNRDWDRVFAFEKDGLNSIPLEVSVWAEAAAERSLGVVSFDLQEVPRRVPPDSPLAPQWYALEIPLGKATGNDVMLAVWVGTQADEAFPGAWQSDSGGLIPETRAQVYLSPKLWYLRLTLIQTQDLRLVFSSEARPRFPELYVRAQFGGQVLKTSRALVGSSMSANPSWNEDLLFVAAEPVEPFLTVAVEDYAGGRSLGQAKIPASSIERRSDERTEIRSRWFNLAGEDEDRAYAGRIHVRACLEGGYHVQDEAGCATSDVRATVEIPARPPIGTLEVGIRGATDLLPVKTTDGTRGTTDAYVVAKYGPKWVRTRTILDRFNPRWNEQHAWDVYDPCTVLTIAVFDNDGHRNGKNTGIGKLRVRLSTLDANRVYARSCPLTAVLPGGARKTGELEVAVRFSSSSWTGLLRAYAGPVLPRMHYVRPLGRAQQDFLRHTAARLVADRLARSEPPLGPVVVQFVLDLDAHAWSMRRSKANWFRAAGCLSRAAVVAGWLDGVRSWSHPPTTVLAHLLLVIAAAWPRLVLPAIFLYAFAAVCLRFRRRPRGPFTVDARLSCLDAVGREEVDEELDGIPTARSFDQVRFRYDRLRALAGRAQTLVGDLAAEGERLEALFSWRDPRATGVFAVFCLCAAVVLYMVPREALMMGAGFYYLRHPRFRGDIPPAPVNFFRRLPSFADQIL